MFLLHLTKILFFILMTHWKIVKGQCASILCFMLQPKVVILRQ